MSRPEPSPLESWLQENADSMSLQQLAFSSGVHYADLELIAHGDALPDWNHIQALRRIVPDLPVSLLKTHAPRPPAFITTLRGTTPPGCTLLILPVSEMREGDYMSYIPITKALRARGNWVQVTGVRRSGRVAKVDRYEVHLSDVQNPINMTGDNPVRVARISANDEEQHHARHQDG